MADAWQILAPAAARPTAEPLFDFRKRKPKTYKDPVKYAFNESKTIRAATNAHI